MKKIIAISIVALMGVSAQADLTWGYSGDLAGINSGDGIVAAGWFVQMYQDVNSDSTLGSISVFDSLGVATGTGVSDDVLLASFTDTLTAGKAGTVWTEAFPAWSSLYGDSVYSVLYNAAHRIGNQSCCS